MSCEKVRNLLGPYVDGEAAPDARREVEAHVSDCYTCSEEFEHIRKLAVSLGRFRTGSVPSELWTTIEHRLDNQSRVRSFFPSVVRSRSLLAIAASIVVVIGLGLFGLPWGRDSSQVHAESVDFAVLLDGLQHDAVAAFDKFLTQYKAVVTTPEEAKRNAFGLNFDLPLTLPGGFELQTAYVLRFGEAPGVAARYDRGGEFLGVVFHAPVLKEHFGTHKDRACVVGKHRGHSVPVGDWSLVHLTDPTTCHCVLSRLNESTELPAVMAALAPLYAPTTGASDHRPDGS